MQSQPVMQDVNTRAPVLRASPVLFERARAGTAKPIQAFVLDANSRQALVCVRALGRAGIGVGAVDCSEVAASFDSRWCAVAAVAPSLNFQPDAYVDALLQLLDRYPARVIIPTGDGSIEALRARRADLERHVTLALGAEPALDVAVNKARTLAIAGELGLAVPRSVPLNDPADVPSAMREIGYPAVLKPRESWVERNGEATRLICHAVLSDDDAKRVVDETVQVGGSLVAQEWLPGAREAISVLYAGGRVWARFAQVAHRMHPPLGGSSVLRESIPLPSDATADAERLIQEIDLEGYSEIEFRRNRAGRPVLMEINPRLSASVEIAVRAGVNFPLMLYRWAEGDELREVDGYRAGLRMRWLGGDVRYLSETFTHQGMPDVPPIGRAVGTFLLDFLRPTAYDYVDLHDMRPAVVTTWRTLMRPAVRVVRRLYAPSR